jgi:hypothetical protein
MNHTHFRESIGSAFVIALTLAPVKPDCFTSNGERFTDISWNASSAIGFLRRAKDQMINRNYYSG